jgi:hypothetical protein
VSVVSSVCGGTGADRVVDNDGRYGRKGGSHTLTEATVFRGSWIKVADDWKLKSREQIGQPKVLVDKPPSEW